MLNILYEDNHLLVLNKPSGLLTQPSGTDQTSLEHLAKEYIQEKYNKPGNVFLEAIHRLDKPVSGVIIFCKTSKSLSRMNAAMRSKNVQKIYWALLEKIPQPQKGTLEHCLIHDDFQARISPEGKLARLTYQVLKDNLVEIKLDTGRYHQIRVQFSAIGCPIIGDFKYGSKKSFGSEGIALHHRMLEIDHPITGLKVMFKAPCPFHSE